MDTELTQNVKKIVQEVYNLDCSPIFEPTDEEFGDLATNIAFQLSPKLQKTPQEIAGMIADRLRTLTGIEDVSVAGPGFINIRFSIQHHSTIVNKILKEGVNFGRNNLLADKTIVCEYSDPNPFKVLHAGHLYTSLVGDAVANLLEAAGAKVHRVNFGGDVGLHVAKTMWAIVKELGGEHPEKLNDIVASERLNWVSARYVEGNEAYEVDSEAKEAIVTLNKKIYEIHNQQDKSSAFAQIYWTCRQWSYDGFDALYEKLEMKPFEKYYPESLTTPVGLEVVKEGQEKGVFETSDGAVVYKGEADGLHTRVFLTSEGLPTYETKDLGLAVAKWRDYEFDKNIMITGNDIIEYMKVVQSALSHFYPSISEQSRHLTHGMVKLAGGMKMSSRKGNILRAEDILDSAKEAYQKATNSDNWGAVLAAVKYAFLKQRIGGDIIYDPEESVNITGNSGPYLQYAHARAMSIVAKVPAGSEYLGDETERSLLKKMGQYQNVVKRAVEEMMPHHIANYLFELSQTFNSFYESERVIGSERQAERLSLVKAYAQTLKNGLAILGISAPDSM